MGHDLRLGVHSQREISRARYRTTAATTVQANFEDDTSAADHPTDICSPVPAHIRTGPTPLGTTLHGARTRPGNRTHSAVDLRPAG